MAREGHDAEAADQGYRPGYSVAADRILDYIEQNDYGPGARLPTEAEFATLLGVSRSITREALKVLAATGQITTQRGRGIFVAEGPSFSPQLVGSFRPTNVEDIMKLFEYRALQEKGAAELAAVRSTPAELMAMESALKDFADHIAQPEAGRLGEWDALFHEAVARGSHNPFLVDSMAASRKLQRKVVLAAFGGFSGGPVEKALEEHRAIYEAIRRGDAEAAGKAAIAHLDRTRKAFQAEIDRRMYQKE